MKPERFGPYRLLRLIARGATEVYEAQNTTTQARVAVKIVNEWVSRAAGFRERTQHNAFLVARVRDPHLVPIGDVGEIEGHVYVETALIGGRDLEAILARDAALSPARVVAIVGQTASALDAMHTAGLVSRNVTPGNILVTPDDSAYLLGLEIGPYDDNNPDPLEPLFRECFAYWAPERFTGYEVTPSADVYALTCVLYECLTGHWPYPGSTVERQVGGHIIGPPPKPSGVRLLPTGFDEVIARGMAKRPEDRYATAGDLARAAADALATPMGAEPLMVPLIPVCVECGGPLVDDPRRPSRTTRCVRRASMGARPALERPGNKAGPRAVRLLDS